MDTSQVLVRDSNGGALVDVAWDAATVLSSYIIEQSRFMNLGGCGPVPKVPALLVQFFLTFRKLLAGVQDQEFYNRILN